MSHDLKQFYFTSLYFSRYWWWYYTTHSGRGAVCLADIC